MAGFDAEDILSQLTVDEKISLLSGRDFWHTQALPRLNVPSIRMSDGPNGIRGTKFFNGAAAACLPCGTALGATWDAELMCSAGKLLATEARSKGVHIVLGPTVNIPRSPLGGRGFESFSEDPFLSGTLAAAQIKSLQSEGVGVSLKHFVCNDQEHERKLYNAIVSDRALREIYMYPFQIAVRDAQPWAIMASYNRVNGRHVSEGSEYLQDVLRKEWGFDGAIISDWFGTYSATGSINAGLDLEMPGPTIWRGALLRRAMSCGKVKMETLDERVRKVLQLVRRTSGAYIEENAVEVSSDTTETATTLRELSSASIVLLKNTGFTLPFKKERTTAVIGPNAKTAAISGGGSASLRPFHITPPYQCIAEKVKSPRYTLGALSYDQLPLMNGRLRTRDGRTGFNMKIYSHARDHEERKMLQELVVDDTLVMLVDYKHPHISGFLFYADVEAFFTPDEDGDYVFGLSVNGTGKLFVDGQILVDNATNQEVGDSFLGAGTKEEAGTVRLTANVEYRLEIEFGTAPTQKVSRPGAAGMGAGGFRVGCVKKFNPEEEIERAVALAKEVDQVIICAGQSAGSEAEGHDRIDMGLGSTTDTMISAVIAANANTAVVIQSGTPVSMPWVESASAIVHAWYGGNEGSGAIADVLFGDRNPSGKLPLTFPKRVEDNPAFLNFRSERGRVMYGEDIFVGYRFYEKTSKDVLFPFGHGLSYTNFNFSNLMLDSTEDYSILKLSVDITNQGTREGAEVVQVYVRQVDPSIIRPLKELKGFTKVSVPAGDTRRAMVTMDRKCATSFWDESRNEWTMEKGSYQLLVGSSSDRILLTADFEVEQTVHWVGL